MLSGFGNSNFCQCLSDKTQETHSHSTHFPSLSLFSWFFPSTRDECHAIRILLIFFAFQAYCVTTLRHDYGCWMQSRTLKQWIFMHCLAFLRVPPPILGGEQKCFLMSGCKGFKCFIAQTWLSDGHPSLIETKYRVQRSSNFFHVQARSFSTSSTMHAQIIMYPTCYLTLVEATSSPLSILESSPPKCWKFTKRFFEGFVGK